MFIAAKKHSEVDIAIFAAAVSDASPKKLFNSKIKKENLKNINLNLTQKSHLEFVLTVKKRLPLYPLLMTIIDV